MAVRASFRASTGWSGKLTIGSMAKDSKRNQVRDEAEQLLRRSGKPLHHSEIARVVLAVLHVEGTMSDKDLNTCLHDDPQRRFLRVGRGTWALASAARSMPSP
jgi:hypothetical protein